MYNLKQVSKSLAKIDFHQIQCFGSDIFGYTYIFELQDGNEFGSECVTVDEDEDGNCTIDGICPKEWYNTQYAY